MISKRCIEIAHGNGYRTCQIQMLTAQTWDASSRCPWHQHSTAIYIPRAENPLSVPLFPSVMHFPPPAEFRDVVANKERELVSLYTARLDALETSVLEKDKALADAKTHFKKLQEDFLYNLNLVDSRDRELERGEAVAGELRKDIDARYLAFVIYLLSIQISTKSYGTKRCNDRIIEIVASNPATGSFIRPLINPVRHPTTRRGNPQNQENIRARYISAGRPTKKRERGKGAREGESVQSNRASQRRPWCSEVRLDWANLLVRDIVFQAYSQLLDSVTLI